MRYVVTGVLDLDVRIPRMGFSKAFKTACLSCQDLNSGQIFGKSLYSGFSFHLFHESNSQKARWKIQRRVRVSSKEGGKAPSPITHTNVYSFYNHPFAYTWEKKTWNHFLNGLKAKTNQRQNNIFCVTEKGQAHAAPYFQKIGCWFEVASLISLAVYWVLVATNLM